MNAIFEYILRIKNSPDEFLIILFELLLIGIVVYWAVSFLEGTWPVSCTFGSLKPAVTVKRDLRKKTAERVFFGEPPLPRVDSFHTQAGILELVRRVHEDPEACLYVAPDGVWVCRADGVKYDGGDRPPLAAARALYAALTAVREEEEADEAFEEADDVPAF